MWGGGGGLVQPSVKRFHLLQINLKKAQIGSNSQKSRFGMENGIIKLKMHVLYCI